MLNYISFEHKTEKLVMPHEIKEYPIGSLIFSILDTDFKPYITLAENTLKRLNEIDSTEETAKKKRLETPENAPEQVAASLFFDINSRLKKENELLYRLFSSQSMKFLNESYYSDLRMVFSDGDTLTGIKREISGKRANYESKARALVMYFEGDRLYTDVDAELLEVVNSYVLLMRKVFYELNQFQSDIVNLIEEAIDVDENTETPLKERCANLHTGYTRCFSNISLASGGGAIGHISWDMCALAYLEFEHMRINAVGVRKCGYCGRYFLPYSTHSKYCERIDPEKKKSCKDFAGALAYDTKVADNMAKSQFKKWRNSMHMRCERSLKSGAEKKYTDWRKRGNKLLKQVESGEISLDEFLEKAKPVDL